MTLYEKTIFYSDCFVADIIFGINKNVWLYSTEVLDENNTSSMDRLAAGIEWLIDERVNIINISLKKNIIPDSVKKLDNQLFANCMGLEEVRAI